ncbi:hypothetical protein [Streptomyces sp. NPDC057966]|uniref:hypothetical protein n=1 Tax=Streptomyces sp. NPDC057966 TaxID=3346292 RepID=UPI0036ED2629
MTPVRAASTASERRRSAVTSNFQKRYERRVAQHEKERQEKAARRQRAVEPPIDLASRRKR